MKGENMKKVMKVNLSVILVASLIVPVTISASSANAAGDVISTAQKFVKDMLAAKTGFTPPAQGAKAQKKGAVIGFVISDLSNGGMTGVLTGVKEAAKHLGWKVKVYDGQATVNGRTTAMNAAIADKVDALILGGVDATEQAAQVVAATAAGIPSFGWHSGPTPGAGLGMKTNITTDPLVVARQAASYAIAKSGKKKFGAVIFTDSAYQVAIAKSDAIAAELKKDKYATVLEIMDSPISATSQQMPAIIANMLQKYGKNFTYFFGINGAYANGAAPALQSAGVDPKGQPWAIAAGDGDSAELNRIRTGSYQLATVAEPLYLQAWQLVDAINSTFGKKKIANWVVLPGLIDKSNVPKGDIFDPASGYRKIYLKIWDVK
jgi:ribose transport system substrate-binding protein